MNTSHAAKDFSVLLVVDVSTWLSSSQWGLSGSMFLTCRSYLLVLDFLKSHAESASTMQMMVQAMAEQGSRRSPGVWFFDESEPSICSGVPAYFRTVNEDRNNIPSFGTTKNFETLCYCYLVCIPTNTVSRWCEVISWMR